MKILAIDASTDACSVALMMDTHIISRFEWAPQRHADLLLPMVESLLHEFGLELKALDALAYARGPGSFTGLRIATGVVQGLAYAVDCPVIPVSTLAIVAQGAWHERQKTHVLAALDARLGEVYWGAYCLDGSVMKAVAEEVVCLPDKVPLPEAAAWFGAGSAWSIHADSLCARLNDGALAWDGDCVPDAKHMLVLAKNALGQGHVIKPEQALPVYLRDNVAVKPNNDYKPR